MAKKGIPKGPAKILGLHELKKFGTDGYTCTYKPVVQNSFVLGLKANSFVIEKEFHLLKCKIMYNL